MAFVLRRASQLTDAYFSAGRHTLRPLIRNEICELRLFCILGVWEIAYVPGADRSRRLRASLHKHSHLLAKRVLADRSLDLSDAFHG